MGSLTFGDVDPINIPQVEGPRIRHSREEAIDEERVRPIGAPDDPAQLQGVQLRSVRGVRLLDGTVTRPAGRRRPDRHGPGAGERPRGGSRRHRLADPARRGASRTRTSTRRSPRRGSTPAPATTSSPRSRSGGRSCPRSTPPTSPNGRWPPCAATSPAASPRSARTWTSRGTGDPMRGVDALVAPARAAARPGRRCRSACSPDPTSRTPCWPRPPPAGSTSSAAARTSPRTRTARPPACSTSPSGTACRSTCTPTSRPASHRRTRGSTSSTSPSRCSPAACSSASRRATACGSACCRRSGWGRCSDLVARAGLGIVTLPITNLYLQGRDATHAAPRGITAVRRLLEAGIPLAAGGDNLRDPFNPAGRADPFETTSLLMTAGAPARRWRRSPRSPPAPAPCSGSRPAGTAPGAARRPRARPRRRPR